MAIAERGWWRAHMWLILRRASQAAILTAFLLGPFAGIWIVKGNLSSSLTLGVCHHRSYLLRNRAAGHQPSRALISARWYIVFYPARSGALFVVCRESRPTHDGCVKASAGGRPTGADCHWLLGGTLADRSLAPSLGWVNRYRCCIAA
jgi:ferredoxin-type protein NapH